MIWLAVSLLAVVVITMLCIACFARSSDPTCPYTCTLPPSTTELVEPWRLPADMRPASTPLTFESSEETITRLQNAGFAAEARIELLERALAAERRIVHGMSNVAKAPMIAQFNELDAVV